MIGLGLPRGFWVTLKNFVRPAVTVQYPDRRVGLMGIAAEAGTTPLRFILKNPRESIKAIAGLSIIETKIKQHSRFRGNEFTFYEDRCTACASCAKYCPLGIIRIVTDPSNTNVLEGDKYNIETFDIDMGRCMFCGLCVEACPYDALHMGTGFEEGTYKRSDLVIDIDRLKAAPKHPSQWYRPQLPASGYNPMSDQEASWRDVHRHEKPSHSEQEEKWGQR